MNRPLSILALLSGFIVAACAGHAADDATTSESGLTTIAEGSDEARAVLEIANTYSTDDLGSRALVPRFAAQNIVLARSGPDGVEGGADDRRIATIAELTAIPGVGSATLDKLLAHARARGLVTPPPVWRPPYESYSPAEKAMVLETANRITPLVLDPGMKIPDFLWRDTQALSNIAGGLRGPWDTPPGGRFRNIDEVYAQAPSLLPFLLAWAKTRGIARATPGDATNIFDPASCSGMPLTTPEIYARFAPGSASAPLGTYQVAVRSHTCVAQTGCTPWAVTADVAQGRASLEIRDGNPIVVLKDDRTCDIDSRIGPPQAWKNFGGANNGIVYSPYAIYDNSHLAGHDGRCERVSLFSDQGADPLFTGKLTSTCLLLKTETVKSRTGDGTPTGVETEAVILGLF